MDAVVALRDFTRFFTKYVGALDPKYQHSELNLIEARLLYEINAREAPLASEIQSELGLDAGYASRLLRRFQTRGWIARGRGEDGRRRPIELTSEGRATFAALDKNTRASVAAGIASLSEADRETLVGALGAVRGLLEGKGAPWSIRTFRTGDMGLIAARQSILYADYGWGRPMEVLQGEVTTSFLRDFKPSREQCWVAERGGTMAGSIFLVDAGENVGQLRLLYVEPWARGLGIGEALVAECLRFGREAGYDRIRLWTHTILASARRIYEAHGFRIVSTDIHDEFGEPVQGETWELALKG